MIDNVHCEHTRDSLFLEISSLKTCHGRGQICGTLFQSFDLNSMPLPFVARRGHPTSSKTVQTFLKVCGDKRHICLALLGHLGSLILRFSWFFTATCPSTCSSQHSSHLLWTACTEVLSRTVSRPDLHFSLCLARLCVFVWCVSECWILMQQSWVFANSTALPSGLRYEQRKACLAGCPWALVQ